MTMRRGMIWVLVASAGTALACSSGSGAGGSSGDGGGGSSGGSGTATFSCTLGTDLCTEVVAPPSAMAGEQQACSQQMGTFGLGCSPLGVVGCCSQGVETQCVYSASEAMVVQPLCAKQGKTWSTPDGGSSGGGDAGAGGAGAFIGNWMRSGTQTVTCPSGTTTNAITGVLMIEIASPPDSIAAVQPDGCVTLYAVAGSVATAAPSHQTCMLTTEAGVAETISLTMHTLTLSADGLTLVSMGSETIDKTTTMTVCTAMSSGTYTRALPM